MKKGLAIGLVLGWAVSAYAQDSTTLLSQFLTDLRAGVIGTSQALSFKVTAVGVGSLPTCNAGAEGQHRAVNDANATFTAGIGATVANGGANHVPVYCDGTNWKIG